MREVNGVASCVGCLSGHISRAGQPCTACYRGSYTSDGVSCYPCLAGTFGNESGLSSPNCSGICPPGTFSDRYAVACTDCLPGRYSPEAGFERCMFCDNYKASKRGATKCFCKEPFKENADGICSGPWRTGREW